MVTRIRIDRPITSQEVAVIRAALERVPVSPEFRSLAAGLPGLRAVERCGCGCDSVDFHTAGQDQPSIPVADGVGETPTGGTVGVTVWGQPGTVTALEISDLGAGTEDQRLPVPETIRPFDNVANLNISDGPSLE